MSSWDNVVSSKPNNDVVVVVVVTVVVEVKPLTGGERDVVAAVDGREFWEAEFDSDREFVAGGILLLLLLLSLLIFSCGAMRWSMLRSRGLCTTEF